MILRLFEEMVALEVRGDLRGGKCWFAVESKTFEISIEVV